MKNMANYDIINLYCCPQLLMFLIGRVWEVNISKNKQVFIKTILDFRDEIINVLNRTIYTSEIERLREEYQGRFSADRFKEYLVSKTALHIVMKYIFIRMMTEGEGVVSPKLNNEGINNWNEMTKNYRGDYLMLFKIATEDLRRDKNTNAFFEPCLYDEFLDKLERSVFNKSKDNSLDKLMNFDFKTLDPNTAVSVFDNLYPSEDRKTLQGFLEESKITTYLMESLGLL